MSRELEDWSYSDDLNGYALSAHALAVYRYLCWCHNAQTGRCDPSTELVTVKLRLSAPSVKRAYAELRISGLLTTEQKHDKRGYVSGLIFKLVRAPQRSPVDNSGPASHTDPQERSPEDLTDTADGVCVIRPTVSDRYGNKNREVNREVNGDHRYFCSEPSRFCRNHPQGTDEKCLACGRARTNRQEWFEARGGEELYRQRVASKRAFERSYPDRTYPEPAGWGADA